MGGDNKKIKRKTRLRLHSSIWKAKNKLLNTITIQLTIQTFETRGIIKKTKWLHVSHNTNIYKGLRRKYLNRPIKRFGYLLLARFFLHRMSRQLRLEWGIHDSVASWPRERCFYSKFNGNGNCAMPSVPKLLKRKMLSLYNTWIVECHILSTMWQWHFLWLSHKS